MVDEFENILREKVKREGIEELLEWLRDTDFYTAPASTKYHGAYKEGLAIHSMNVYNRLLKEIEHECINVDEDSIAICGLLHDICKVNFYQISFRNTKDNKGNWIKEPFYSIDDKFPLGHGEKSVMLLSVFIDLKLDEMMAINSHMGGFDVRQDMISKAFNINPLGVLLHIADLKTTYIDKL